MRPRSPWLEQIVYVNKEQSADQIADLCYIMAHRQAVHLQTYVMPVQGMKKK
jgi:hypothetical protein